MLSCGSERLAHLILDKTKAGWNGGFGKVRGVKIGVTTCLLIMRINCLACQV